MTLKKGLAVASVQTREMVARLGGQAVHSTRGLETVDPTIRSKIASLGGKARAKTFKKAEVKRIE